MSAEAAPELIRSIVDRILRRRADADEAMADVREIYKEAKGNGLDKTAIGRLVVHIRKAEKGVDTSEADALFELYLGAYEQVSTPVRSTERANRDAPIDWSVVKALRNTNSEAA
jgi:uncharacterized protein (UPF0335 family)